MLPKARLALLVSLFAVLLPWLASTVSAGQTPAEIRTPKPSKAPRINGPKIYGARPGHPFLYRIPCTGNRPMRFSVSGLPSSLHLDPASGIITGATPATLGEFMLTLKAKNARGKASRPFKVVVGDTIGLTPQMGWNDWYTFYAHPTDSLVRKAADAMVASGMADFGYQYVDMDDAWERKPGSTDEQLGGPPRDANGNILPNAYFPNMPSLTAYIHSLGLKAGIYSGPGPLTCARFEASYQHEDADAHQIAAWGFDLLKYDWCSYRSVVKSNDLADLQLPYRKMSAFLKNQDRDIVFNMCQYGMGDVWKWGREVGGNSWRTTGDLGAVRGGTLPGFYAVGFANAAHNAFAGPGGWNDPDYILIGTVGDALNSARPAKPTTLTAGEQYSYMSMWSLMASPLIFSGDMNKLDAFTLNVLCNAEVIDIDQDSLGKQAKIVRKTDQEFILAKPLEDGSVAVGLFNLTEQPRTISFDYAEAGTSGRQRVRDVWRQKDIGSFANSFKGQVGAHDVLLVKLTPK
ncbi:MAG TPA: putative Ig domain-containing protein [Terracidiphilus sp.]|jgi:alpha-galactosidase|nr:putative Ig domain-containing protein [Terracidiphilus sp.]